MKKFAYLLTFIIPRISHANTSDDGLITIFYNKGSETKQAIMPIKDYDDVVNRNRKIYGIMDRINGLS